MRSVILSLIAGLLTAAPAQAYQQVDDGQMASSEPMRQTLAASDMAVDTEVLELPARLDVEDTPLHEALQALHESSGVALVFSPSLVPAAEVTCHCEETSIGEALDRLLGGTPTEVVTSGRQVIIAFRDRPARAGAAEPASLPLPAAPSVSLVSDAAPGGDEMTVPTFPQGSITGQIVDVQTGAPLSSVQVYIPGQDVGVLTQPNGRYLIQNAPTGTYQLTAERIGYRTETAEITVSEGETLVQNFQMQEAALELDEMVVTGTPGETQRRSLGNVVNDIGAGEIDNSPAVRVEQAIGNTQPGVRLMAPSGQAGGETSIRIRGNSSLALQNDPLIYVDGVRISSRKAFDGRGSATSRLQDIDPSTIQSIEIIKGPAASTLYGTEASNGVIQIITKKGQVGETTFEASVEGGINWQPHPARNFSGDNGLHFWRDPEGNLRAHNLYLLEQQDDRFGQFAPAMWQYGPIQRYSISARGGSDVFRYFGSATRSDEQGYSRQDWTERWNTQLNATVVPTDELTIDVNVQRTVGSTRDMGSQQCWYTCWADPATVNAETRGSFTTLEAQIFGTSDIRETTRTVWSATINHNPTEWFNHRIQGGVDDSKLERVDFTPRGGRGFGDLLFTAGRIGDKQVTEIDSPTRTLDYVANLTLPVTEGLESQTSGGMQFFEREETRITAEGEDFPTSTLTTISGAARRTSSESFVENVTVGGFIQNQFSWEDRMFLTGAVRLDQNSAFGADAGVAIYPKISGSWVISEEDFFPEVPGLSQLRLRGAWGESGLQPDAFAATRLFEPQTGPDGQAILTPQAFGNPDLKPETGSEIEVGGEAVFLDGRVSLDFTYYNRTTKDAIVPRPISPSVGFPGSQLVNIGQTSNSGTETSINVQVLTQNPVRWNMGFAITSMSNNIDEMGEASPLRVVALSGMRSRSQFHVEGFPIAGLFARKVVSADFVSGNSGEVTNVMCDGGTGKRGREMGGEPVPCSEAPRVFWGQTDPAWTLHWNTQWTFLEDFRFSASIDAQGGNWLNADYLAGMNTRHSRKFVLENDPIFQGNARFSRGGNVIHKAGFAKLRSLNFRYTLPDGFVGTFGADNATFGASWFNVATLWIEQEFTPSGQRIWDPEMQSPNFEFNGIATGSPPPLSHLTFELRVRF